MLLTSILDVLNHEKLTLFKTTDYINSYYHQIIATLESLKDSLFPDHRDGKASWKDAIDHKTTQIIIPNIFPENLNEDIKFNSNVFFAVINNIHAIQNAYLFHPREIENQDIKLIRKAHLFLFHFLEAHFSRRHPDHTKKEQSDPALSMKRIIEEKIRESINPFFDRLEMILDDEYRVAFLEKAKQIVGSLSQYKTDPDAYDRKIAEKYRAWGRKNYPDLNSEIVSDLDKPESEIEAAIRLHYQSSPENQISKK
jgi:hypothetical protein